MRPSSGMEEMSVTRRAACHCGDLKLVAEGDPAFIAICYCDLCQRRTGSSFNLGAWFDRSALRIEGEERIYTCVGEESGDEVSFHFCPRCGTSV